MMALMLILIVGFFYVTLISGSVRANSRPSGGAQRAIKPAGIAVNDIHSQLNGTRVSRLIKPTSVETLQTTIREAKLLNQAISISGGRHAMGGQQFGANNFLIDMRS